MGAKGTFLCGLAAIVFALGAIGCGGESSTGAGLEETASEERPYPHIKGAAREFLIIGGDNLIQAFGNEATAAERENASRVIHAWMRARVAEDWATDCKYLAGEYRENLVWDANGVTEGKVKTCAGALKFFGDEASGTSGNTLTGPIDSLRVTKTRVGDTEKEAFAQWHGPNGIDWVVPLRREDGVWGVASASPIDRTK